MSNNYAWGIYLIALLVFCLIVFSRTIWKKDVDELMRKLREWKGKLFKKESR